MSFERFVDYQRKQTQHKSIADLPEYVPPNLRNDENDESSTSTESTTDVDSTASNKPATNPEPTSEIPDEDKDNNKPNLENLKQASLNRPWKAYVDGAYSDKCPEAVFIGVVLMDPDEVVAAEGGHWYFRHSLVEMHNVGGEIMAAWVAINRAYESGSRNLNIFYDYRGIQQWPDGGWKANKEATRIYRDEVAKFRNKGMKITFKHVQAHSGNVGNERADYHATSAMSYYFNNVRSSLLEGGGM